MSKSVRIKEKEKQMDVIKKKPQNKLLLGYNKED